ncbi:MAG TPA: AmmeMemoRadiSam system protein B [Candidatus Aminicenantes bacterium]|nr:AmmeMemoRadiSam system protein B [Candidatus Aminicenantes bacterium]HRY65136.1 AmmeMemoRadiSam system protein B [Candidatus Aminicenantes bacterium]HRZ72396.1 AmmeMemoRadiSam system protein B [Candidatus Aminicenantes bacterium]
MTRKPCVAGQFYPGTRNELLQTVAALAGPAGAAVRAVAVVSPHAGYVYSGPVAGAVFASVNVPASVVMLGPAHHEIGPLFAVQARGAWQTPLGESAIDEDLAGRILGGCPLVEEDEAAHRREHSLEVQLPFIQYFQPEAAIVPICVSSLAGYDQLATLGRALAAAVCDAGRETLLLASTDMSHYVSQRTAERKDMLAIRRVLDLDAAGLFETVVAEGISMCGFQPTAAVVAAALGLGATGAELIRYQTSGEASGDYEQVVGYAGIRIV